MRKTRKWLSIYVVIAIVLNMMIPMAYAADLPENGLQIGAKGSSVTDAVYEISENIITRVRLTVGEDGHEQDVSEVRLDPGQRVKIYLDWALPANHGYKANSTFTFDLPDKFTLSQTLTGDLSGGVGSYTVTPEGEVTLLFNDTIENNQEMHGYFYVWRKLDASKLEDGTEQKVLFPFKDEIKDVSLHFKQKGTSMDKTGVADKGFNPSSIHWIVDLNKDERIIREPRLEDVIPAGLDLDEASIKVERLQVHLDGTVSVTNDVYRHYSHQVTDEMTAEGKKQQRLKLTFDNPIDHAYRVTYTTCIRTTEQATYSNHAMLYEGYDDQGQKPLMERTGNVSVKFSQSLSKKAGAYDPVTQTVNWAIEYNYNEQRIPKDQAYLVDTYNRPAQELVENSLEVYRVKINPDGRAALDPAPLAQDVDYTLDEQKSASQFKLSFKQDIQEGYYIRYQTKVKDRVFQDGQASNVVVMHDGKESQDSKPIREVILSKSGRITSYKDKEIQWTLQVNRDRQTMNNVVIRDSFADQGLTFLESSLRITGLEPDQQYIVAPDPDYTRGFQIKFIKPVTKDYIITYTTQFDSAAYDKQKVKTYKNRADMTWEDSSGAIQSIGKTADVTPIENMQHNGNKTGVYNAEDKSISWTIDINYNQHHIPNAVVTDQLTGEQTLLEGSLMVNKTSIDAKGQIIVGERFDAYDVEWTKSQGDAVDGFQITFRDPIDSSYRITYTTSLKSLSVDREYANHATLYDNTGGAGTKLFEQSKTIAPVYGGESIDKKGRQGTAVNDMDHAYWTIHINRSQSYIAENAVLEDTMSPNQIPLKDTFRLYQLKADANGRLSKVGEVDPQHYTLEFHENAAADSPTFTITFHQALESAYVLEYQTYMNAVHLEKVTNSVSFAGKTAQEIGDSANQEIVADFAGAGGGAIHAVKGNITVVKVDAADPNHKLSGAKFELYNAAGDKLLATSDATDHEGKAQFINFKSGDYQIKEIIAPSGYVADTQWIKVKFDANNTTQTFVVKNKKIQQAFVLTKVDQDDTTRTLAGAVFRLEKKVAGGMQIVSGKEALTTDHQGQVVLANLEPGDYQLIELKAPKGYKLDPAPISFTIDPNQTVIKEYTMTNRVIDNGSVELTKVDGFNGAPLEGVLFELQDAYGHPVRSQLKTDADGKIMVDGLAAGRYQFVEVAPLRDYDALAEPLPFDIANEDQVKLRAENHLTPGSVKLTKVEAEQPMLRLQGAVFKLLDADKRPVQDREGNELELFVTDKHGEMSLSDLRPGIYYVEEVQAPVGYRVDNRYTKIEVVKGKEVAVIVKNARDTIGGRDGENPVTEPPIPPDPNKPIGPTDPVDPSEPGTGTPDEPSGGGEDGASPSDGDADGGTSEQGGGKDQQPPAINEEKGRRPNAEGSEGGNNGKGKFLPKTGEDSPLPIQLAGLSIMLLGIVIFAYQRNRSHHS
ncbi:LPXTG cell wall anchor domain-containing protein [Paenibacillus guangzhouensis]|uniref:LPXTG cell wall anchor domain-containing protein n=1 Tax=Paenibacillus guangzhouensis TaxID=1473112 RepID=UPI001D11393A|nr:LPXTG cell wall anchor domain-containing protein [Paenibacillus guangzhouensis]